MKDFQIYSDSSCDLPIELIEKYSLCIIPYYVTFDMENYFKEHEEISNEEFYQKLAAKVFPKTSLPSVQDYINAFRKAIEAGQDVLCFCLTSKFSGSYQSAVNAKSLLEEDYPDASIVIVDSIQATAGQGLVVIQAARMKEAGYTLEQIAEKIEILKETARIMFTVDSLEYLQKGGRIGKVTSLAGAMLNLKPMIVLKEAELMPYSNIRGRKKSLDKTITMAEEYFTENNQNYEDYDFCMANATTLEETKLVQEKVEALIGRKLDFPVFQIGVTIGTYTGPGAIGICFVKKFDRL
ncbi:DegV family protein [[Clostridium] polysaccharolyticum]|uniref:EDD domain protein, DegV family n=1 Tax=[Clostridium] polysaccharolyticum TaxID=29364 RepID=A0A1I0CRF0_9FIRM|nr:DegV family protein [[Clostridium] polysaccharolyticum]SET22219.1 EDD domain protein, DegV family [[Clostridium] polysaccharolyticum]